MRNLLALLLAFTTVVCFGQDNPQLLLTTGAFDLPQNAQEVINHPNVDGSDLTEGYYFRYIQFNKIPTDAQKETFASAGIQFLFYQPQNTFAVRIALNADLSVLESTDIRGIHFIRPEFKITPAILSNEIPGWALLGNGMAEVQFQYFDGLSSSEVLNSLDQVEAVVTDRYDYSRLISVKIPQNRILDLAALPFVTFIQPIDPPADKEDDVGRSNHRTNVMATDYAAGRHYDGTGVIVALGDDGIIGPHIDYTGRENQSNVTADNGDHGDHVAGIIFGGGNLDPTTRGMAWGADLWVYNVWDAVNNTPTTYTTPGVRITSTSYGNGCNAGYNAFAQTADNHVRTMPSLMHVFSCGNSGTSDCGYGAGNGWGNITGGVKIGKNVIAVGNVTYTDGLANSSSRGPAHDGRIKPDMCANGTNVYSTIDPNTYTGNTGTSMAAPGVSGTLAQLYHAYRTLNGGTDPNSGLMKATLQNTAEDLGNPGPDYSFGYGRINGARAVRLIEDNRFTSSTVATSGSNSHSVTVPANTAQVRIMVYWTDYEAAVNASVALVNDLDMVVTDPTTTTFLPWILDPTPNAANLSATATRGADHLNNMEQVTIDNPVAGSYTVDITGFNVPQGPQEYFLLWEFITDDVELTYPIGGEGFNPGETETIRWDAYSSATNFNLEYSTNNGTSWSTINNNVSGLVRWYDWSVPSELSGEVLVRVTQGTSVSTSVEPFSIIQVPQNINVMWSCSDSLMLDWDDVPGATGYEISWLGTKYMDAIGTSTSSNFLVPTSSANTHWFSVKALGPQNAIGRRANAVYHGGGVSGCPSPFDGGVSAIISPSGLLPDCQGTSGLQVTVEITNYGLNAMTGFPVNYQYDANPIVTETYAGTIATGQTVSYTFTTTLSAGAAGTHTLDAWTTVSGDANGANDNSNVGLDVVASSLASLPYSEDFETFAACATTGNCGGTVCNLSNGWVNAANGVVDDADWRTDAGGTPSNNTGPSIDHAPGTAAGKYLYTEASGGCTNSEFQAITPCFDLTTASNPYASFWYHMEGADMGDLHMDVLSGGAWVLDASPVLSGGQGSAWREGYIDLTPYIGTIVNIRFRGITGGNFRSDMAIDDVLVADLLPATADFNFTPSNACQYAVVDFTDASSGSILTWDWDFGAGASPATANTPGPHAVTYSTAGPKTVSLTITDASGSNTSTQNLTVGPDPTADYSYTVNAAGDVYTFTDLSTGTPTNWFWNFGDANTSTAQNPVHQYTADGTYNVYLIVDNACGQDTVLYVVNVSITFPAGSSFSYTGSCLNAPVIFTDNSTGTLTNWNWNFGAGATPATANTQGPHAVTYSTTGTKTVTLLVSNALGGDGSAQSVTIEDVPTANFSSNATGNGDVVNFTDLSTNATSWSWDFGDSNTSTSQNPSNTYAADGTYTVTLIASNSCGADTISMPVVVTITVPPTSMFSDSGAPYCELAPITFTDNSTGTITGWDWDFGVGASPATANTQGPHTVTYSSVGTKTITLITSNSLGADTSMQTIDVTALPVASFSTSVGTAPNIVNFMDLSTGATSWLWEFDDGSTSTLQNPIDTLYTSQPHTVVLIVTNACGSDTSSQIVQISGVEDVIEEFGVLVFPNPTNGNVNVEIKDLNTQKLNVRLMDVTGKEISNTAFENVQPGDVIKMDLQHLANGTYHMHFESDGKVVHRRIQVMH